MISKILWPLYIKFYFVKENFFVVPYISLNECAPMCKCFIKNLDETLSSFFKNAISIKIIKVSTQIYFSINGTLNIESNVTWPNNSSS